VGVSSKWILAAKTASHFKIYKPQDLPTEPSQNGFSLAGSLLSKDSLLAVQTLVLVTEMPTQKMRITYQMPTLGML